MKPDTTSAIAEVVASDGRDGVVQSRDGALRLDLSAAEAPTPEHLFAAAYAACFHSALKHAAQDAHLAIPGSSLIARVCLADDASGGASHLTVELRATLPGLDLARAGKLLRQAHATCPYSRAVRGNVDVKLTAG